jgi:hypothetical protein
MYTAPHFTPKSERLSGRFQAAVFFFFLLFHFLLLLLLPAAHWTIHSINTQMHDLSFIGRAEESMIAYSIRKLATF